MGKLFDEQARLRDVYATERPDPKQVGQVYGNIAKLQQQMAEIATDAHNRMFDLLTKEQRDQLQQWRRGGMMGPGSMGRGGAAPNRPQMMR
jgi:Spy/CpxP family protein refolding chaperone